MRWPAKLRSFFRSLFLRRQAESDLEIELREHLESEIENNIRAGMSPEEARFAAQRLIGPVALYKEQCRDARGTSFIENLLRDFRYAVRILRRSPLFTLVAIVTLALGIGANTTVFTFIENVLLGSLPVDHPEQLVSLNWGGMQNISYPNYLDFRDRNNVFSNLAAHRFNPVSISVRARENFRVWGYEVSGNYFQMLGVHPLLGQFFGPAEDDKPGAHPVVVISHRWWQTYLAADANVIGRTIKINGFPFTIVAVAPPSFLGTELIVSGDYWAPMTMESEIEPGNNWLSQRGAREVWLLGRVQSGVSVLRAQADLDLIGKQLTQTYDLDRESNVQFQLCRPGLIGEGLRRPLSNVGAVLLGLAGLVLLLACVNLAGMLLARASDRHREIGIRLAIGASRVQLLRQLMTESLLLAIGGACLGYFVAAAACRLFSAWHPAFGFPVNTALYPNTAVLGFTVIACCMATVLSGLLPAFQAIRTDLIPGLTSQPSSHHLRRWSTRDCLVAGQIAVSVLLVICSVLVLRSLQHALTLNLGFQTEGAVAVSFDLSLQSYAPEKSRLFDSQLLAKTAALPGLKAVGIISNLPLRFGEDNRVPSRADRPVPKTSEERSSVQYNISPGYLKAAGTRLLSGRDINAHDRQDSVPVVVVNEALAQHLFGNENPIGKRIRLTADPTDRGLEIIGIVETGKYESLGEDPHSAFFLPIAQSETKWTTLVARTSLPAQQATELLRKSVLDLDPELTIFNAGSLKDQLAMPLFPARISAIVLGTFGVLALILAATGLFALMAYAVSRRTREIGIRMALGARSSQVLSSVLGRTLVLCAVGISIGVVLALAAGRLLLSVLYGISPNDPATYATAIFLMTTVALLASWNPVTRAIHVDPASTLREQ